MSVDRELWKRWSLAVYSARVEKTECKIPRAWFLMFGVSKNEHLDNTDYALYWAHHQYYPNSGRSVWAEEIH